MAADSRVLQIIIRAKDEASAELKKSGANVGVMGAAITAAGIGMALALNKAGDAAADYGAQVLTVQRFTGASAEESSKLAAILGRFGIEGRPLGLVFKALATAINTNSPALKAMNIATKDATGKNREMIPVLRDVAEYYSKAKDKTEAVALASKVLGRGYMALLPLLAGGAASFDALAAKAEKFGLVLTQDNIDAFRRYNVLMKDNEQAMKGLEVQIGLLVIPMKMKLAAAVLDLLGKFSALPAATKKSAVGFALTATAAALIVGPALMLVGFLPQVAAGLAMVASSAGLAGSAIQLMASGWSIGSIAAMGGAATGAAAGVSVLAAAIAGITGYALTTFILKLTGADKALAGWGDRISRTIDPTQKWVQVVFGLGNVEDKFTAAQIRAMRAANEAKGIHQGVAAAVDRHTASVKMNAAQLDAQTKALQKELDALNAQKAVLDARQAVQDLGRVGSLTKEYARALRDLGDANRQLATDERARSAAEAALAVIVRGGLRASQEYQTALKDYKTASRDAAQADRDRATAVATLQRVLAGGLTGTQDYAATTRGVGEATLAALQAQQQAANQAAVVARMQAAGQTGTLDYQIAVAQLAVDQRNATDAEAARIAVVKHLAEIQAGGVKSTTDYKDAAAAAAAATSRAKDADALRASTLAALNKIVRGGVQATAAYRTALANVISTTDAVRSSERRHADAILAVRDASRHARVTQLDLAIANDNLRLAEAKLAAFKRSTVIPAVDAAAKAEKKHRAAIASTDAARKKAQDGWATFSTAISDAIRGVAASIGGPIAHVVELLAQLDPWARHSPSLVDKVRSGALEIATAYKGLGDMDIGGPTFGGMTAGRMAYAGAGGGSMMGGAGGVVQVHVFIDGTEVSRALGKVVTHTDRSGKR